MLKKKAFEKQYQLLDFKQPSLTEYFIDVAKLTLSRIKMCSVFPFVTCQ